MLKRTKKILKKNSNLYRRWNKVSTIIRANSDRVRMAIYRSLTHIYVQIIDDNKGITIASASDIKIDKKMKKTDRATEVWKAIAKAAIEKWVKDIAFDRNWYKYHGRVKMLADAARSWWLNF